MKLKIGLVLDDSLDSSDGVQQYVLTLGNWLTEQGHEVHYLVGQTKRTDILHTHSLSQNVKVRFNGNRMSIPLPASGRKLSAMLKHEKFDVLHVQIPYSPWLGHRIIKLAPEDTALIGTFHIVPQSKFVSLANHSLSLLIKRTIKKFDEIVSVSSAAQTFAKDAYGIDSTVVPNMVDVQRFRDAKPLAKYKSRMTIMFLGRLVPRKGCFTLLKAINILAQDPVKLPPCKIVICGKGPLEVQLKQYIKENKLSKIVDFTGYISEEDKPNYVAAAEIMAFPSQGGESFGIVLIEALAAGRAVVLAGDNVGYRSVLSEKPELLFPPDDAQALADKLKFYIQNQSARKEILDWGAAFVKQFDTSGVGKKVERIYEKHCDLRSKMK